MRIPKELKAWLAEEPDKRRVAVKDKECGFYLCWKMSPAVTLTGWWDKGQGDGQISRFLLERQAQTLTVSIKHNKAALAQERRELRAIERKLKGMTK